MATKTGRNDPCPCGSAKKYKRCCLEADQKAESAALAAAAAERAAELEAVEELLALDEEINAASNVIVDLIDTNRLDQAEQAARDLIAGFPELHDGYDALGAVYEARGDNKQAADCYRKVIDFVRADPEDYDPDFESTLQSLIAQLDPGAAA